MKVLVQFLLLSALLTFCAPAAFADDLTPAEEEVCDFLQDPVFSPGLFGLCNAYCQARDCDDYGPLEDQPRSCQQLYDNFVIKASGPEDPLEPPCLEPQPLVPPCACWPTDDDNNGIPDALQPENLPLGAGAVALCLSEPDVDFFAFDILDNSSHATTFVLFPSAAVAGTGVCDYLDDYLDDSLDESVTVGGLDLGAGGEFEDCVAGLAYLQEQYGALTPLPCDFERE